MWCSQQDKTFSSYSDIEPEAEYEATFVSIACSGIFRPSVDTSRPSRDPYRSVKSQHRCQNRRSGSLCCHWTRCNAQFLFDEIRKWINEWFSFFLLTPSIWSNCYGGRLLGRGRLLERCVWYKTNIVKAVFIRQEAFTIWEGASIRSFTVELFYVL